MTFDPTADVQLWRGDCLKRMRAIPDGAVDAVITDPPYGLTNLEYDRKAQGLNWSAWWQEVKRVAKPTAAFVVFAIQPFATDLINTNREAFKYDLVWHKNIATGFLDANRKPLRNHELVLIFGRRFKWNRVDWQRRKYTRHGGDIIRPLKGGGKLYSGVKHRTPYAYGELECPKSVLEFAQPGNFRGTENPFYHPSAKPLDLLTWLIQSYSQPGDLVLDPFAGSGTTGVACVQTGRRFLGIELDRGYFTKARKRIQEAQAAMLQTA